MALVFGLGNPGARYARTRHNAGWRVVDLLVERWKAQPGDATDRYRTWRAEVDGRSVDLMVPLTMMNLSGAAVEAWRERSGLAAVKLLVVADDVYLPLGALRMRAHGSSGGHRGLDSIEAALGTREYARLRVGVGAVDPGHLREHVLDEPEGDERTAFDETIVQAADAVTCWLSEGLLAAMNRYNRKVRKEVSES